MKSVDTTKKNHLKYSRNTCKIAIRIVIVGTRGLKLYIGPWALANDVGRSEDR